MRVLLANSASTIASNTLMRVYVNGTSGRLFLKLLHATATMPMTHSHLTAIFTGVASDVPNVRAMTMALTRATESP